MSEHRFFHSVVRCLSVWLVISTIDVSAAPPQDEWATMEDAKISVSFLLQPPVGSSVKGASKLIFSNKYALSAIHDPDARYGDNWTSPMLFDLREMAWFESSTKTWVTQKKCQDWEKASLERTKSTLARSPNDEASKFADAMTNPNLQLQNNSDRTITIFNNYLTYKIVPAPNVTPQLLRRYIAYDQMNAYQKAMNDRQFPPTAQVQVVKYLEQQKIFPSKMVVTIKTGKGNVIAITEVRVDTIDGTDVDLLRREIARAQQ